MRLVIIQQVQLQQQEKEKEKEKEKAREPFQRGTRATKSLRLPREEGKKSFFSSLFGGE